jgi:glycosyltransferase involved in cell wall biosynthesis
MPVYNGVKYLRDSIGSVVEQTMSPTELFVIDDGSTDGSQDLLEAIETPFPKYILHQRQGHQSAARNLAASRAIGKYLAFIDHDDNWYPRHLERLIEPLEEDERLGWSYSDIDEIDAGGALVSLRVLRTLNPAAQHPKTCLLNMLAGDMFIFPSAAVVRRRAFEAVGGFDERLAGYEDDDLFLRLFRAGWLNTYLPDSQVRYRRHCGSSSYSERMWASREVFARKLIDTFPDDPELVRYYVRDFIAPRFFGCAKAEYFRHFPHRRFEQCRMAVELMRRFSEMMRMPFGRRRLRHGIALLVLANPRLLAFLYPALRRLARLPQL